MARIRSVHPELFLDDAFMELSPDARLLAIGIWTQCDDHGIFEWKPKYLKAVVCPADNVDVVALLGDLVEQNCIKRFTEGGREYGAVRNFCLYQRPKKPYFKHPFPDWCRTYVAIDRRKEQEIANEPPPKSPPVTPSSPTSGEKPPHRRGEKSSGEKGTNPTDIKKPVVVVVPDASAEKSTTTTTAAPKTVQGKASGGLGSIMGRPLPVEWTPNDETCGRVALDFGMMLDDINAELPTFHALNVQNGTLSQDWSATFYLFAKRWKERAARTAPRLELSKAPATSPLTETDWNGACKLYAATGRWSHQFGPDPTSPACRCPPAILEKHMPNPAAIPVLKKAASA